MTTNYDPIAEQYQRSKQQPWRTYIEAFSLLNLVGPLAGKSAIDIACGEGFYTRMLRGRGAVRVTGVDLSAGMIELAAKQEQEFQAGIQYIVGDARQLAISEPFDIAVAAYLLNYARNEEELRAMCNGIYDALDEGGRFVTVNCCQSLNFSTAPSYRKYGFETFAPGEWKIGSPIQWKFYLDDGEFDIENYHLGQEMHEAAFRDAGFREVKWHSPELSPAGLQHADPEFWACFFDHSPITLIECTK
ncbi:class I SAM-dependent methyltransferase [Planctomicrobium sp. SH668]|uniref:class I SAM-dependent methyltransferase n=1 Tax=Planctomicrobium sp. SH668 TaxID=3448126 RepID=UPI003F5C7FE1